MKSCSPMLVKLFLSVIALTLIAAPCAATVDEYTPIPWDSHPVWSPDGGRIAFVSTRNGPEGSPHGPDNIWVVNADGTNLLQLTTDGGNTNPTWSPDGTKIAFTAGAQIRYVTVATGSITELTKGERGCFDPDWCPVDATKVLAWFKTGTADNDIFIIDTTTSLTHVSGRKPLKIREGTDKRPRWSRDGSRIAFVGEVKDPDAEESAYYLMTMTAQGTDLQTHCQTQYRWISSLSWYPSGGKVVMSDGKVCDLATGQTSQLFSEFGLQYPDISPDGQRVAYVEYVSDSGRFLFIRNIDGTNKQQITFP